MSTFSVMLQCDTGCYIWQTLWFIYPLLLLATGSSKRCPWNRVKQRSRGQTYAEYVRVRLVGSGLGSSLGSGCSFPSSHTRLPSLKKGKEREREELGERSGVPEGDVNLGSAMSEATLRLMHSSAGAGGQRRYGGRLCHFVSVRRRIAVRGESTEEHQGGVGMTVGWLRISKTLQTL